MYILSPELLRNCCPELLELLSPELAGGTADRNCGTCPRNCRKMARPASSFQMSRKWGIA